MNVQIEITMKNYPGRHPHVAPYRAMIVHIQFEGGEDLTVNTLVATNPVEIIEQALDRTVDAIVRNEGEPADITIILPQEVLLTAGLQSHLTDKYTSDPLVNSIQFA
ncbi:hypothetical protein GCM10008934_16400 [Virgibacillus salarius]|uniref:hypothetical protein n=1 Tax=Virgibacillus salarius TaxID=447199 RepID=UPI0031D3697D